MGKVKEAVMDQQQIDMMDDAAEYAAFMAESFYFSTVDRMADLVVSYGRDRVMADVTEAVLEKLHELESVQESAAPKHTISPALDQCVKSFFDIGIR
jgi:hypothetical protein